MIRKYLYSSLGLALLNSAMAYDQAHVKHAEETIEIAAKDVSEQNSGNYPLLNRLNRQGSLGAIQHAWDRAKEGEGSYSVTYSQAEVIRLKLREFMTTTVVLPSWEKIIDINIGDSNSFEASKATEHIVLMKPKNFVGADSSITVIGSSGLVYSFYVRSEGFNSKNIPDLKVMIHVPGEIPRSFPDSPRDQSSRDESASFKNRKETSSGEEVYPQEIPVKLERMNHLWSMSGDEQDRDIAPVKIWDDGVWTWFYFGEHIEENDLPIILMMIDGVDTPVNTRKERGMVIAEGVGRFSLRSGKKVVCAYPSNLKKD